MKAEFDYGTAAGLLASGRTVASFCNAGAILAGIGLLLAHDSSARLLFAGSLLSWACVWYFGIRVAIDAELLRKLAAAPTGAGPGLDEFLHEHGLARPTPSRTPDARIRGAVQLWKRMLAAAIAQALFLAASFVTYLLTN